MRTRTNTNRRGGLILAAVAAVALMGGSAFTASTTIDAAPDHLGYGETTVEGGTVTSLDYTLSSNGELVSAVTLGITEDLAADSVHVSLNGGESLDCVADGGETEGPYSYTCDTSTPEMKTSDLTTTAVTIKSAPSAEPTETV